MPSVVRGAAPSIIQQPAKRTVFQGANYTFSVTADGTAPLSFQWRREELTLPGQTNASLSLSNIQSGHAGLYTVLVTNVTGSVTSAPARLTVRSADDPRYPTPHGGWAYLFTGDSASNALAAALDGTWNRQNGDDSWDGSGRGLGDGLPGGVATTNGVLTLEDAISSGSAATDNRRYYFTHDLGQETAVTNANTLLNDGVTLILRARLTPPTDPWIELLNAPNGWVNANDGKGMFGIRQSGGSGLLIGFSLNNAMEDSSASATFDFGQAGLHMNTLNGNVRSATIDPGEGGTLNLLSVAPTAFHEFWITIQDNGASPGTHNVSIYVDGSASPNVFNVTAGSGVDAPFTNYLALGLPSTGQRGSVDVDFFGYKPGARPPSLFNEPVGFTVLPTNQVVTVDQAASFNVSVTGTPPYSFQWYRNGAVIVGATNEHYTTPPVTLADAGIPFTVVVSNEWNVITSAPPAMVLFLQPPTVTAQPQSLLVSNGDPANFSVTATSPAQLRYQWQLGGTPLANETNSTLVFSSATPANAGDYRVVVTNPSGSVTSTVATLTVRILDYGDAPDPSYPTLKANNGARHVIVPGLFLGQTVDTELDGQPSMNATGDDAGDSDDEDGVTFSTPLRAGQSANVEVVASTSGRLDAWIDFNADGSWAGAGEQIFTNQVLHAGTNVLTFGVSSTSALNAFARFRFSSAGGLSFNGPAADGEVEDYAVTLVPVVDLGVAITESRDPVAVDGNLAYSILISNAGPSTATGVKLTNIWPAGVDFVLASSSQGGCTRKGALISCALGSIASGATATVTLFGSPSITGEISDAVFVTAQELDLNPANGAATASTTVLTAPSIITSPENVTVTNGGSATFVVEATGSGSLIYQWKFNGGDLPGQNSATLVVANAQPFHAGNYIARVSNAVGAVESAPATLTVLMPPVITEPPQSRVDFAGATAVFSVAATGTAPLHFQWFFNGNVLVGSTNDTLTLPDLQLEQSGFYRVSVSNSVGVVLSAPAELTVLSVAVPEVDLAVTLSQQPNPVTVGSSIDYVINVTNFGPFTATAVVLTDVLPAGVIFIAGSSSQGECVNDGGNFNCSLGSLAPGAEASVNIVVTAVADGMLTNRLQVAAAENDLQPLNNVVSGVIPSFFFPSIVVPPQSQSVTNGGSAMFSVTAAGTSLRYQWQQDGLNLPGATNATLVIANAQFLDAVVFTVRVSNEVGEAVSGSAVLTVLIPATITVQPQSVTVVAGQTTSLSVSAIGTAPLDYQWQFEGTDLPGATNATLVISNAEASRAGVYRVFVANQVRAVLSVAVELTVISPPVLTSAPQSRTNFAGSDAVLIVTATGTPPLRYQWYFNQTNQLPRQTNATLTLTNLRSAQSGQYRVVVTNGGGTATSMASLEVWEVDFGDAPDASGYPTILIFNGARHRILPGVHLGNGVDFEPDGRANETATGDDLAGSDDEDGVTFNSLLKLGQTAPISVVASTNGFLDAWVDFNANGLWTDFGEHIFSSLPLIAGVNPLTFVVPASAATTNTFARFRFSTVGALGFDGWSNDGEVEDYAVAIVPSFDLAVNMIDSPDPVLASSNLAYAITITNRGPSTAASVVLTNRLPTGVTFLSATVSQGSCFQAGGIVSCSLGAIPANGLVTATVLVKTGGAGTRFSSTVVAGSGIEAEPTDNEASQTTAVVAPPSRFGSAAFITVADATAIGPGQGIPYPASLSVFGLTGTIYSMTVTLSNMSHVFPDDLDLLLVGPGGQSVLLMSDVGGSFPMTEVTPTFDDNADVPMPNSGFLVSQNYRPSNYGADLDVFPAPAPASPYGTSLATFRDTDPNGIWSLYAVDDEAGDAGLISGWGLEITTLDSISDLVLTLPVVPGPVAINSNLVYVINLTNRGPASANGVTLVDTLPAGVNFVSASFTGGNCVNEAGRVTCVTSNLATKAGATLRLTVQPTRIGLFTNAVSVSADHEDLVPDDNFLTITSAAMPVADLSLSQVGMTNLFLLGNDLTYVLRVTNRGPSMATAVRLVDVLPAGVPFVTVSTSSGACTNIAGVLTCDFSELPVGAGVEVTVVMHPTSLGLVTNSVVVTSGGEIDSAYGDNTSSMVTPLSIAANLSVTLNDAPDPVAIGGTLTLSIIVSNLGPSEATGVIAQLPLIAGLNFISAQASQGACTNGGGVLHCALGSLATGQDAVVQIVTSPTALGVMTNRVAVVGDSEDFEASNNSSVAVTTVINNLPSIVVADVATDEDVPAVVPIEVGDLETAASSLVLSGTSSNTNLVTDAGIEFGGADSHRTVILKPVADQSGSARITVIVLDGNGGSNTASFTLTVNRVNDPPTLAALNNLTVEIDSGPRIIPLSGIGPGNGDEAQALTLTVVSSAPHIVPDPVLNYTSPDAVGTLTLAPQPGTNGSALITVTVRDDGASNNIFSRNFTVAVKPPNLPPVISGLVDRATAEDTAAFISFVVSDVDSASSTLTLAASSSDTNLLPAANLSFLGADDNRTLRVLPAPDQFGMVTITVFATDTDNGMTSASFLLMVTPVNDSPTLDLIAAITIPEDGGPHTVVLSGLSSGATNEPQALILSAVSSDPSRVPNPLVNYTSPDVAGSLVFNPVTNATGTVTITVTLSDGGLSNSVRIRLFNVTVTPVNDPPTISALADITMNEGSTANAAFWVADLESPDEPLTVTASSSNTNLLPDANVVLGGTHAIRTINLLPIAGRVGTTTVTLKVTDSLGASTSRTFLLTVVPVAGPPLISAIADQTILEDTTTGPVLFSVDAFDANPDDFILNGLSSNTNLLPAANIVFGGTGRDRTITLTPATNQFGSALVSVTVEDTNGLAVTTSLRLVVNPLNDAPTLDAIADQTVARNSGEHQVPLTGLGAGAANELQMLLVTATSSNPALIPNPSLTYLAPQTTGTLSFVVAPNVLGTALITVTVDDGQSTNRSVSRDFTVTVEGLNGAPVLSGLSDQSVAEDTLFVATFTIEDDAVALETLGLSAASSDTNLVPAAGISFGGSGNNRRLMILPTTNVSGAATISVTVTDTNGGSATEAFVLTVNPVNDPPVLSNLADQLMDEDANGLTLDFTVGDVETAAANLVVSAHSSNPALLSPANIVLGGNGSNRTVSITTGSNQSGSATVTLSVRDAGGLVASDSFVLSVEPVNDPPSISAIPDSAIDEDTVLALAFVVRDTETPAGNVSVSGSSSDSLLVEEGNLVVIGGSSSRVVRITPATNQAGVTTITLIADDRTGGTATNRFQVTINPVNDPPTLAALGDLVLARNAGVQTVELTGIGSGAANENQFLTITAVSSDPNLLSHPLVNYTSPNPNGTLTFTPQAGATGTCQIAVAVSDGGSSNNVTTRIFRVTIGGSNTSPTISDLPNQSIGEDEVLTAFFVISDGETAPFNLALSAVSTNATLVANTNIFFDGDGTNRMLRVIPSLNRFGTTLITVTVGDGTLFAEDSFVLTVEPVNDLPTLNPLADVGLTGNPGSQSVPLLGISSGASNENQTISITVATDNPGLFFNQPSIAYTSPNATGTLTFRPDQRSSGSAVITVTVRDNGTSNNVIARSMSLYMRPGGSAAPTISTPANQTIGRNSDTGPIPVTLTDADTPLTALTLQAVSSNTNLIPNAQLVLGGSGGSRTVTATPAPNQSGTTTISLSVRDNTFGLAKSSFVVTVNSGNDAPTLSTIADQVVAENNSTPVLPFTVSDTETPAARLTVTAVSTNTALVPVNNIALGGTGTNRALRVIPAPNQSGATLITLTATDDHGGLANQSFLLTVTGVAHPPVISILADQFIEEDSTTALLPFTISDRETPAGNLDLSVTSANSDLVPVGNVSLGGNGTNRTVLVTPMANLSGSSLITLSVMDSSGLRASNSFVVTVNAVNDTPTLNPLSNVNVLQASGPVAVNLGGIASGAPNENQLLAVTATSSNPALIPELFVNYTSPGSTGTLVLIPNPTTNGTATIAVTVSDGQAQNGTVTRTFDVAVSGVPGISDIADRVTDEDVTVLIDFIVSDAETAPAGLILSATSSDTNLVDISHLVFSGTDRNRRLSVTPLPNQWGQTTLTITVRDADGNAASESFVLFVNEVNHPPTMDPIGDLTLAENAAATVNLTGIGSGENDSQPIVVRAISSNPGLIPDPQVTYTSPGATGTLFFAAAAHATGIAFVNVIVTDGQSDHGSVTQSFQVTVLPINDPPMLASILPQVTDEGTPLIVGFVATDAEHFEGGWFAEAFSSDPTLVPPQNIRFGGGFGNFSMLIEPARNQSGTATITVSLSDAGGASASGSFLLTVNPLNDPPTLDHIPDQATDEDGLLFNLPVVVGDLETPSQDLTLSATCSNPSLTPTAGIEFGGSGRHRTITVVPALHRHGSSLITVTVTDGGGATASESFLFTVRAVNSLPTISDLPDLATEANISTATIPFSVSDAETAADNLVVVVSSSDATLVPPANLVFGGQGTNRSLIITPAPNRGGTATLTVTVTDGNGASASDTLVLTVHELRGAPVIVSDPTDRTEADGGDVSFDVIAAGDAPLNYQWQRDGADLPGQTNATLVLEEVHRTDAGFYRAQVSNASGTAFSASAMLRISTDTLIMSVVRTGTGTQVSFTTEFGFLYTVEYRDIVGAGGWNTLDIVRGTGSLLSVGDPAVVSTTRFYRVRVE